MFTRESKMPFGVYKGQTIKTIPQRHLLFIRRIMGSSESLRKKTPGFYEFLHEKTNPFGVNYVAKNDASNTNRENRGRNG